MKTFFGIILLANAVLPLPTDFCVGRPAFNPHPEDCSKYVICLAERSIVRRCTFPFEFASVKICYLPFIGHCPSVNKSTPSPTTSPTVTTTTTTTTTPKPTTTRKSMQDGIYLNFCQNKEIYNGHPTDCQKYISCRYGFPLIKKCPFNLYYNPSIRTCSFLPPSEMCAASFPRQLKPSTTSIAPRSARTYRPTTIAPESTQTYYNEKASTKGTQFPTTPPAVTQKPYRFSEYCDPNVCKLPDCSCAGENILKDMHVSIPVSDTPKMILFTMDDNVNDFNFKLYSQLFDDLTNPNGCPVKTTYFVSGDFNNFYLTKRLYDKGHEIAVHSLTHRTPTTFWSRASYDELVQEIVGMKKKLESYGIKDIVGYRNPFLQTAGDTTFSVLKDNGFLYDSTLPTRRGDVWWPYTLDYNTSPETCVIAPCPQKSYPGLWEVPLTIQSDGVATCSMFDGCHRYRPTADGVYGFFKKNFEHHFKTSTAPFPMFGHASWMTHIAYRYRKRGIMRFLRYLNQRQDVYFVGMTQAIEWMKNPTPLNRLQKHTGPFSCS